MDKRYIIALDAGTSSVRAVLFDVKQNRIAALKKQPFKQHYPQAGWVEHNPEQIWKAIRACILDVAADIEPKAVYGIGITNQRETVVVWDKVTGEPVHNAIVWQDGRTAEYCKKLQSDKELADNIRKKTGLGISSYFSASKIKWIIDNVPKAKQLIKEKRLLAGTIDTYLAWKLTKGKVFVTDPSNASRTLLFNINTLDWDDELLKLFRIPRHVLPDIIPTSGVVASTGILGHEVPIASLVGDQQAALFGQACFDKGELKNTYGTGCFMLVNIGNKPRFSRHKMLTSVAWQIGNNVTYAIEGSAFYTGSSVQWLRDEMGLINTSAESEKYARLVPDTQGVYFVPAFSGIGAPYWNSDARASFSGITRGINKNHMIRAVLESIAYSTMDVFMVIEKDLGYKITSLKADGGASENQLLMQFQADILEVDVVRAAETETTALGAIYLAGLATGAYKDFNELRQKIKASCIYKPIMAKTVRNQLVAGWQKAIKRALMN
ncbi:MAG: glycerol kinase GlpK [Firmicutes bacterium]|nr:glycerol kinase GlpK [Bacillota bacterium]